MLRPLQELRRDVHWFVSIAIWNRNKVILALVTIVWGIDVSLLVHGKSLSSRTTEELKLSQKWLLIRYHQGE
jgi:hypothetical protein